MSDLKNSKVSDNTELIESLSNSTLQANQLIIKISRVAAGLNDEEKAIVAEHLHRIASLACIRFHGLFDQDQEIMETIARTSNFIATPVGPGKKKNINRILTLPFGEDLPISPRSRNATDQELSLIFESEYLLVNSERKGFQRGTEEPTTRLEGQIYELPELNKESSSAWVDVLTKRFISNYEHDLLNPDGLLFGRVQNTAKQLWRKEYGQAYQGTMEDEDWLRRGLRERIRQWLKHYGPGRSGTK